MAFWPKVDLSEIYRTDRCAFLDVWLPLAHRVWVGEKQYVELDDLLAALKTADIREKTRKSLLLIFRATLLQDKN